MRFGIVLFTLLLCKITFAQKVEYGLSDKASRKMFSRIIGQNEQGFFVVRCTTPINDFGGKLNLTESKLEFLFFDYNLNQKWLTDIELPVTDPVVQNIYCDEQFIIILFSSSSFVANKNQMYILKIKTSDGLLEGDTKVIDEIVFEKRRLKGDFFTAISKDAKKIFTLSTTLDAEKQTVTFGFNTYTDSKETSWKKSFTSSFAEKDLIVRQCIIDNEGNPMTLIILRPDSKNPKSQKIKLLVANKDSAQLKEIPIELDPETISDLELAIDQNKAQVVMSGFYSEQNSFSSAGTFIISIDIKKGIIVNKSLQSFKAKFINEFYGTGISNKGNELINYDVNKLILRSDGGAVLLAESSFITESSNYNAYYQIYTTSYTYHYDNVLAISINPDGKIDWESILRKNQSSENDDGYYSSYVTFIDQDKIHFVYNKMIRKKTDVMDFTVNNKGQTEEKILIKDTEDVFIMPHGGNQISQNELIIPCLQKNKPNFIKITF